MDLHVVLDRRGPLREQLERQLRQGVRSGRLRPGVRLPSSRLLAAELGVSRGVVVEAYAQLTAEGYLITCGSGGTRVDTRLDNPEPRTTRPSSRVKFDLRSGLPDPSLFPRRAWATAMSAVLRELPDAALLYGSRQGRRRLRRAISTYLGRVRAIATNEEQVFITCGSSHAYALLWSALPARGIQRVAHEDPAWERIPTTIVAAGLEPVPVRVDARGISLSDLYASGVQAVVVSPASQYPTGVVMHPTRRAELIRWARETGGLIVEDDYDSEFRFTSRPIAPLRSIAGAHVAYVGSASKVLAPALRLGWLITPPDLTEAVAMSHEVYYAQPSVADQAAFALLLENGGLDRHLRKARGIYRSRRAAALTAVENLVPSLQMTGGAAGLHLMAWLPPGADETEVAAEAMRRGVAVDPLHAVCAVSRDLGPALVLGYGAISAAAIPTALALLAESVSQVSVDGMSALRAAC